MKNNCMNFFGDQIEARIKNTTVVSNRGVAVGISLNPSSGWLDVTCCVVKANIENILCKYDLIRD